MPVDYSHTTQEALNLHKQQRAVGDAQDLLAHPEKMIQKGGLDALKEHASGTTFYNPGSADVGGSPEAAAQYKAEALGHMGDNDALQAGNSAAMGNSLANMRNGHGAAQTTEDPRLAQRAAASRAQQMGSLDLSRDAALGNAPSEAAYQTKIGMNDLMGSRAGAMGNAHSLAGLTGAQAGTAAAAGQQAGGIAAAGGMGRSKEIGDAIGMYGTQAGNARQQDFNRLGISNDLATKNAGNDLNWRLGNAQLAAAQGGLGVQMAGTDMGWQGQAMAPEDKQFQYDQEMAAAQNGANADAAGASIARNRESRENARQTVNGVGTAGLTLAGSLAGPAGAAGGAAAGGMLGSATSKYW